MPLLDKTTDNQLTVIHIWSAQKEDIKKKKSVLLTVYLKQRMNGFSNMQKDIFCNYDSDVCHTLIVMISLSALQMANISMDSLLDDTSCTDLICRCVI